MSTAAASRSAASPLFTPQLVRLLLSAVGSSGSLYLLLSVVPLYVSGEAGAGLATGAMMLATVVVELVAPRLIARRGYRDVLAAGLLLLGAPSALLLLSPALPLVLAVCVARGAGLALVAVVGTALAAELLPADRRSEGIALYGVAAAAPAIVGLPLGVWLSSAIGFDAVFLLAGGLALASLAAMPGLPREIGRGVGHGPVVAGLRGSGLVGPGLAFAATTVAAGVVVTFLPLAVSERQQGLAALALFAQAASAPAARWAAGRYADRHGPAGLLVPALALTAIGAATLVEIANPVLALAGMLVFGAGFGAAQTATLALMLERVPATEYARVERPLERRLRRGLGRRRRGLRPRGRHDGVRLRLRPDRPGAGRDGARSLARPAALRGPARWQDLLDQLQQPHRAEGLDQQLRVRDALHGVAVGGAGRGGQDDDRDLRAELGVARTVSSTCEPVHHRHHQVEQDQVGLQPLDAASSASCPSRASWRS